MIPDKCTLVAVDCDGSWALEVHDKDGNCIALLKWPEKWPTKMGTADLEKIGFEVV